MPQCPWLRSVVILIALYIVILLLLSDIFFDVPAVFAFMKKIVIMYHQEILTHPV